MGTVYISHAVVLTSELKAKVTDCNKYTHLHNSDSSFYHTTYSLWKNMSNFLSQICDLGSARSLEHTACQTTAVGTYAWMAPEVGGSGKITFLFFFQLCACIVHAWLVPRLLFVFCVCWFLCITQLVAMQLYFSWLDGCFECVFNMSSLTQLWVHLYWGGYTVVQRQCRHNDVRLTESGNAKSEQLLVMFAVVNQPRMTARRTLE